MRSIAFLSLVAALLPWHYARASGGAYDAPVLPPPSYVQVASPVVPMLPLTVREPTEGPLFPLVETIAEAAPTAPSAAIADLPTVTPEIAVNEPICHSYECGTRQGYPSCGTRALCPRFWFASAEATFLGVHAATNGQVRINFDDSAFPGVELAATAGEGLDGFAVAPRVTLGYQFGPRWAVAGRFWTLSDSVENTPGVTPAVANLDAFFVQERVRTELDAIDLEAIRSFTPGRWKLDAAGGVRHAAIGTSTRVEAFADFVGPVAVQSNLISETGFDGTGPTVALTGRRRLGTTPIFLFATGRSSMLWGSADAYARVDSVITTPADASPATGESRRPFEDHMTWIGEVQLGVQWEFPLEAIPATAFLRTAAEYQRWAVDSISGGTPVEPPLPSPGSTIAFSSVSVGNGRADFYGLAIAAGFTW